jgi:hypothetical protein
MSNHVDDAIDATVAFANIHPFVIPITDAVYEKCYDCC